MPNLRDQIRNVAEALRHIEAAIECLEAGAPVRGQLNEIAAVIRRDLHPTRSAWARSAGRGGGR
jgi:hypothetical protein